MPWASASSSAGGMAERSRREWMSGWREADLKAASSKVREGLWRIRESCWVDGERCTVRVSASLDW